MSKTAVLSFFIAAALHLAVLFGAVFTVKTAVKTGPDMPAVIKLTDLREEAPASPSPPVSPAAAPSSLTAAAMTAEQFTEAELAEGTVSGGGGEPGDFLPMHLISVLPKFSEEEIRKKLTYPPIARRAGLEGTVYLELFVDARGLVRNVSLLKEDPPDRGFGEAAVRAFTGLRGSPALADGETAAVRYRYPVRFSLR
ncbi:MAG: energy transducer TonB [Spirochaetaceae bacterium]|jgi:protein TonB|nr:energy transducer TonB [Spirochaetaceae bacterium]